MRSRNEEGMNFAELGRPCARKRIEQAIESYRAARPTNNGARIPPYTLAQCWHTIAYQTPPNRQQIYSKSMAFFRTTLELSSKIHLNCRVKPKTKNDETSDLGSQCRETMVMCAKSCGVMIVTTSCCSSACLTTD